ncbi:MAG: FG-GAP-like repeat-containing protein [Bacteroidales bacterium]|nr:FG-GAP-like repeat-containing protein [Bacteroidales bacterium]
MKYIYLTLLLLTAGTLYSYAADRIISLDADQKNLAGTYIARDTIFLLPDYEFTGDTGKEMEAWIDETLITPSNYIPSGTLPNIYNRPLKDNLSVGTTAGTADVGPTGAATYSIPISVVPGTAGMQPNIGINYSSQSGSGLLGYGWNLSGLSSIQRIGKNFYNDGVSQEVKMTTEDNLVLDGQRLIKISGSNLQSNAKYRTEAESFKDITIKTINGNIYFEVKDKAGNIFEYGSTDDSNIKGDTLSGRGGTPTIPMFWMLSKVTDLNGNYMTYTYERQKGELCLKNIAYAGNKSAGKGTYADVDFFYEARNDSNNIYAYRGNGFGKNLLLRKIKSSYQSKVLREYNFKYTYDQVSTKLIEIEEFNGEGKRYNSTVVEWGAPKINFGSTFPIKANAVDVEPQHKDNFFADFNGDGIIDLLVTQRRDDVSKDWGSGSKANLYLGKRDVNEAGDGKPRVSYVFCTSVDLNGARDLMFGDFDGDGLLDIIRITKGSYGYYYWFSLFNGKDFSAFSDTKMLLDNGEYDPRVGDFDGNGKDELAIPSGIFDCNAVKIGNVTGLEFNGGARPYHFQGYKLTRMDFSGNGKTHVTYSKTDGTHILEYGNGAWRDKYLIRSLTANSDRKLYFGDFNGDGLTDILACEKSSNGNPRCFVYYSTGRDFVVGEILEMTDAENPSDNYEVYTGDVNGDGKDDAVICFYNFSEVRGVSLTYNIYLSGGMGLQKYETYVDAFAGIPVEWRKLVSVIDASGTGKQMILWKNIQGSDFTVVKEFLRYKNPNLFVVSIKNGLDLKTSFSYCPLTDSTVFTRNNVSAYPIVNNVLPFYVVSGMRATDRFGNTGSSVSFKYQNMWTHIQGKGFLGFERVYAEDSLQMRSEIKQYGLDSTYYVVYPATDTVKVIKPGSEVLVSTVANTPVYRDYGNKRYFSAIEKEVKTDHLQSLSQTNVYQYDTDHGNLTKQVETKGNFVKTTDFVWVEKNNIFKNCLQESKVTSSGGEGSDFVKTVRCTYDNDGRITSQTDYAGTEKAVTVRYRDYDDFGNPQTTATSAAGCDSMVTTDYYGERGRFLERSTDALNNELRYEYDPATGNVLRKTEIDGLVTEYTYDGWGNMASEIAPGDIITTYSRYWEPWNNLYPYQALYTDKVTVTGIEGAEQTSYDGWGREIVKYVPGFGNNVQGHSRSVVTRKTYYDNGRLKSTSYPYFYDGNFGSLSVEYTYDDFGRPLSVDDRGLVTRYTYSGKETTVTNPDGTTSTTKLNDSGFTHSVTDASGDSIVYKYNSLGDPAFITSNGLTTVIGYDYRGYKESLKDPNLTKAITYDYDAYGRLKSETNARGAVTTYQYDLLGRKKQMIRPEGTFEYQYVPDGNGKGQLQSVKKDNNVIQQYAYDAFGNIVTDTETFEGTQYTRKYEYDKFQRVEVQTTPSGLRLANVYDKKGFLTEIRNKEGNTLIWRLDSVNAAGQTTQSTLGNGLTRTFTYDTYDYPTSYTLKDGKTEKDRMVLAFDSLSGNLKHRNDITNGYNEVFEYDNLHRLTGIKLNNEAIRSITYYPNGNIKHKYDVGEYKYGEKPHAVEKIENTTAGYSPATTGMEYTSANRIKKIEQQGSTVKKAQFTYGDDDQRRKMQYYENNVLKKSRYYFGSYEKDVIAGGTTRHTDYITAPGEGLIAIADQTGTTRTLRYVHTDYLGSIRTVTGTTKNVLSRYYYDAWGNRSLKEGTDSETRGYTGHEHLTDFGYINMNARLYDPVLGRFAGMDPYVQMPDNTQNFNRYSYALNNPLIYTDPSGEFIFTILSAIFCPPLLPAAIGADLGMWQGGSIANGTMNPAKWDWGSGKTWGYMFGGAAVGAISGAAGGAISTSGIPMANTIGIMSASFINSFGTYIYTGGKTDLGFSFGIASYNFSQGEWGYLGKKGNSKLDNFLYGLGALGNLSDVLTGFNPQGIDLVTEHSDGTGHSALVKEGTTTGVSSKPDPNSLVSVGPDRINNRYGSWHWMKGTNKWSSYSANTSSHPRWIQNLKVNMNTIKKYSNWLNAREAAGKLTYSVELSSCVTHTSIALNLSGIFNIGIHPYLLNAQMYLWSNGIRPWTFGSLSNY